VLEPRLGPDIDGDGTTKGIVDPTVGPIQINRGALNP
jgi:hypothetical protein